MMTHNALTIEQRQFIDLIRVSRRKKDALEYYAATKIQAAMRGVSSRICLMAHDITRECGVRQHTRRALRDNMVHQTSWALKRSHMVQNWVANRNRYAAAIQLSHRTHRAVQLAHTKQRGQAAEVIQKYSRRGQSAGYECQMRSIVEPFLAAELIQASYRRHVATIHSLHRGLRFRVVATLVIQRFVRRNRRLG